MIAWSRRAPTAFARLFSDFRYMGEESNRLMPAASASSTSQVRSSSVSKVRQVPIPIAGTSILVVPSWRRSTRQTYTLA